MPAPDKIVIPHDDYRFEDVGHFGDGRQYMAFGTRAFPLNTFHSREVKRWIAVIHLFDSDGNHLKTESRLVGFGTDEPDIFERIDEVFENLLSDYGTKDAQLGDICIKPFSIVIDDIFYGFIYKKDEEHNRERITLWPNDVVFHPPWDDGLYDT